VRIVDFFLRRYGPLTDSETFKPGMFNLFWGENEDGKTLTIEALIKMLFPKGFRSIKGIERVNEKPAGSVNVRFSGNKTKQFPDSGNLSEDLNISPRSFFNLFVIRNSDLSISDEDNFYTDITERLTGLRKNRITKIKEKLKKIGKLTPTLEVENKQESKRLKDRLTAAEVFLKNAAEFLKVSEDKGYGKLEEELVKVREEAAYLTGKIKQLNIAKKRLDFKKYSEHLKDLKRISKKYDDFRQFNNENYNKLKQLENLIKNDKERVKELKTKLEEIESKIGLNESKYESRDIKLKQLENTAARADETLKPLVGRCDLLSQRLESQNAGKRFVFTALLVSAVLLLLSMAGTIAQPSLFFYIAGAVTGTAVIILTVVYLFYLNTKGGLKKAERMLVNKAAALGIRGSGSNDIRIFLAELKSKIDTAKEELSGLRGTGSSLKERVEEIRRDMDTIRSRIRKYEDDIRNILNSSNTADSDEYGAKLDGKSRMESRLDYLKSALKDKFGSVGNDIHASAEMWQRKIDELESGSEGAGEVIFSGSEAEQAERMLEESIRKIEELNESLSAVHKRIEGFKTEIEFILQDDTVDFTLMSVEDLKYGKRKVEDFLRNFNRQRENIITAVDILDKIILEEEKKIGSLFGDESPVSRYYGKITGGIYTGVYYTPDEHRIMVKRIDGTELYPEQLSGGAYDQLYFAIRAALGERLLSEEKGFFILDDPFLKSDRKRIAMQMEMLIGLAQSGWQIFYFSAKDEVKQHLKKNIDRGTVTVLPIPHADFKDTHPVTGN